MANYDDLKKKARDAIDTIADVSAEAYKIAEEKARVLAKRAKLNAEITRDKALIRRLKGEIGSMYYELHKDDPEIALKDSCDGVTASLSRIAAKKKEIEELKQSASTCACDADCCSTEEPGHDAAADSCGCDIPHDENKGE